jgi:hypothetical protein
MNQVYLDSARLLTRVAPLVLVDDDTDPESLNSLPLDGAGRL